MCPLPDDNEINEMISSLNESEKRMLFNLANDLGKAGYYYDGVKTEELKNHWLKQDKYEGLKESGALWDILNQPDAEMAVAFIDKIKATDEFESSMVPPSAPHKEEPTHRPAPVSPKSVEPDKRSKPFGLSLTSALKSATQRARDAASSIETAGKKVASDAKRAIKKPKQ